MCHQIRVRLNKDYFLELPVTLLERLNVVTVAVQAEGQPLSACRKQPNQNKRVNSEKRFDIGFDADGLLSVRGVGEDERRWNPVLTSNTNRWVHRQQKHGLVEVNEIEIGSLDLC